MRLASGSMSSCSGKIKKFRIDDFLSYGDSRDCEFLIAEAYHTLGEHQTAMRIYESLILYEKTSPVFFTTLSMKSRTDLNRSIFYYLTHPQRLEDISTDLEKLRALNLSKT